MDKDKRKWSLEPFLIQRILIGLEAIDARKKNFLTWWVNAGSRDKNPSYWRAAAYSRWDVQARRPPLNAAVSGGCQPRQQPATASGRNRWRHNRRNRLQQPLPPRRVGCSPNHWVLCVCSRLWRLAALCCQLRL